MWVLEGTGFLGLCSGSPLYQLHHLGKFFHFSLSLFLHLYKEASCDFYLQERLWWWPRLMPTKHLQPHLEHNGYLVTVTYLDSLTACRGPLHPDDVPPSQLTDWYRMSSSWLLGCRGLHFCFRVVNYCGLWFASLSFFFFLIFIFFISWRLITLQYCSGFCHTLTWISRGVTCVLASLSIKESCYSNPKEMKCWESLFCSDFSDSRIPQGWLLRASCGNPCLLSSGLHSH